jgi:hypothetical protein
MENEMTTKSRLTDIAWKTGLFLAGSYLVAWIAVYAWIMEFDFGYAAEYFRLSWIGGLEIPGLIQLASVAISLLLTAGFLLLLVLRRQR